MKFAMRPFRFDSEEALDEGLAALVDWITPGPVSEQLVSLVEQLEMASERPAAHPVLETV